MLSVHHMFKVSPAVHLYSLVFSISIGVPEGVPQVPCSAIRPQESPCLGTTAGGGFRIPPLPLVMVIDYTLPGTWYKARRGVSLSSPDHLYFLTGLLCLWLSQLSCLSHTGRQRCLTLNSASSLEDQRLQDGFSCFAGSALSLRQVPSTCVAGRSLSVLCSPDTQCEFWSVGRFLHSAVSLSHRHMAFSSVPQNPHPFPSCRPSLPAAWCKAGGLGGRGSFLTLLLSLQVLAVGMLCQFPFAIGSNP